MLGEHLGVGLIRSIGIRVFKEAEMILRSQYRTDQVIELQCGELPSVNERLHVLQISCAAHVHVHARRSTAKRRVFAILGKTLRNKTADGEGIAHDESFEPEFFPKKILQQVCISTRGHAVQVHVSTHDSFRTSFNSRSKWRKVDVLHPLFRNVRSIVVSATFRGSVAGKVLQGRHEGPGVLWCSLKTSNLGPRHCRTKIGIFARSLGDTPPARVSCYVQHRCEAPAHASMARLLRSDRLGLFGHCRIPRGSRG